MRHALLAGTSGVLFGVIAALAGDTNPMRRVSIASAYVALALLATSLAVGPWKVLTARPNPVSSDLRRDVGIWSGVAALAHTVVGLQMHLRGRMWQYFLWPPDHASGGIPFRYDRFGFANYTGLAATLIFVLLLALSNDLSLRRLGVHRWKALQRWNYGAMGLVALHAAVYQLIERRSPPGVAVLAALTLTTAALQFAGYRRLRRARALLSRRSHQSEQRITRGRHG
jgi:sulfoxide reductase heme-binding subunit YedZ